MTIEKTYQPHEIEKKWYEYWEKSEYFKPQTAQQAYCIMLPPPNVTGTLHMGHAFQDTIMDALIRYQRMQGKQTLWQGGTDHAGIATQMVVERQLLEKGVTRHDVGRDAFIEKVWEWKEQSGDTICRQMRRLGASVDWSRQRFTMDEGLSEAVREVFVRLYEEGLIYRGKRLVNWDPKLHTAVSDLEVITEEEDGSLWYLRYPVVGNEREYVVVATTRPETMLGDVAVAVNPNDERYTHLIGKQLHLPLCNRTIPVIADEYVLAEFGSGCVKITPAHDFNDHEIGKRHHLEMINIFTIDAIINDNAPAAYRGLPRFVAREKIIQDLTAAELIEKIEPYKIKIPRGDRSGEVIEPYLTDQWFVKTESLAKAAIEVVEKGDIQFYPENWTKIYFEWMHNIQDWCISRQIWWGHRIPAWYDEHGKVYVGRNEDEVRQKFNLGTQKLTQDNDVLDTWFSSALWPFSTLGWPEETTELTTFYPTNVLVTGFDIIFFWVARMIMMGLKFRKVVPFRHVFVHGLIQDAQGQKMSKSKGNVLDPLDIIDGIDLESLVQKRTSGLMQPAMAKKIEKETRKQYPEGIPSYGTDALRFTFCALASTGRHLRFDLARVEGYRNFCNKIWNATRYVLMNVEGNDLDKTVGQREFSVYDRWMQSLWQKTKQQVHDHIAQYRFDLVAQTLYDFIWNQYCDWYLELSKPILQENAKTTPCPTSAQRAGTRFTLVAILEEFMRVMHPLMPFITEEIWQKLKPIFEESYFDKNTSSIMVQPYPVLDKAKTDEIAEHTVQRLQAFVMAVRTLRGEMNLQPHQTVTVLCKAGNEEIRQVVKKHLGEIQVLAKIKQLEWWDRATIPPIAATILVEDLEILIPLAGLIDTSVELKRVGKEIDKLTKEIAGCQQKLNNPAYMEKAPADVVEKERERLQMAEYAHGRLSAHLKNIEALIKEEAKALK